MARSVLDRLATRAMPRTTTSGTRLPGMGQAPTGNVVPLSSFNGRGGSQVKAATQTLTYTSPGQPMPITWDPTLATEAYYRSLWTMRCVRAIAETMSMLPFMAGKTARNPATSNPNCKLATLLGPPPGSPNTGTTARGLLAWSGVQYITTGKFAWELQLAKGRSAEVVGLWPLVSAALTPIASQGTDKWWDGFQYQTPYGVIPLETERVAYAWRPSQRDFRQPESVLESASTAIQLQVGIERFMFGLLAKGLTAAHVVITPPFAEPGMRRAWQEQFLQEFTGFDNSGKTIFGEAEIGEKEQRIPNVQIQQVGTRPVDAQLLQMWQQSKIDVTVALGVPESLIGNASQRTYANADSEYRNFWTMTMLNFLAEIEDAINVHLAPRLGDEVGWFDVSKVVALQAPPVFAPLDAPQAIESGIVTADDVAKLLDIVSQEAGGEDIETAPIGEEAIKSTPGGRGDPMTDLEFRARQIGRELRSTTYAQSADLADKVYGNLARSYPRKTLAWVHDARWERRKVPLDQIQMDRRPGGRNHDKVAAMAKIVRAGGRLDPVVLADTGDEKLKVADGYHRTLAHRHAGRATIDAYVGRTATEHGPWETKMHAAKLTRAMEFLDRAIEDPERRDALGLGPLELRAELESGSGGLFDRVGPVRPTAIVPKPSRAGRPRSVPAYVKPVADKPHAFRGANLAICAECNAPVLAPVHIAAFSDRGPAPPFREARLLSKK